MFTPSLVSMLLHTIWADVPGTRLIRQLEGTTEVAADIDSLWRLSREHRKSVPTIPVLGLTRHLQDWSRDLRDTVEKVEVQTATGGLFVFGRVSVDDLVARLRDAHALKFDSEYLDLGTPLTTNQAIPGGPTGWDAALRALNPIDPKVIQVAIIDRGDEALGSTPDDFNGNVRHLSTKDVEFSQHALDVLGVLVERLRSHGILSDVEFLCALVKPPKNRVGLGCFDGANAVELQQAFLDLSQNLRHGCPMVANISMGTHIGPHNGLSPLEQTTAGLFPYTPQQPRVLVFAAGNDGGVGVSARRELVRNSPDYFRFRTSARGAEALLIEFWWEEAGGRSTMEMTISFRGPTGRPTRQDIKIDARHRGANMKARSAIGASVQVMSLFHEQCSATMNCMALAMTAGNPKDLASLTVDFKLNCALGVVVNAWRVLPVDDGSTFVTGNNECSVTVPATHRAFVSVAGVQNDGSSWNESSRGPTANYGAAAAAAPLTTAPLMAHLVEDLAGEPRGTSFASPRATADIAHSAATGPLAATIEGVVIAEVNRRGRGGPWDPRIGFGAVWN